MYGLKFSCRQEEPASEVVTASSEAPPALCFTEDECFSVEDLLNLEELCEFDIDAADCQVEQPPALIASKPVILETPLGPPATPKFDTPANDVEEELEWVSRLMDELLCEPPMQLIATVPAFPAQQLQPTAAIVATKAKRSNQARASRWSLAGSRPPSLSARNRALQAQQPPTRHRVAPPANSKRRCTHCDVQETPQWREGPGGAETLCNACGVRYKSGRLLPEYRLACSPSYVSGFHSNAHRKVLELRRKMENRALDETASTSSPVASLQAI